MASLTVVLCNYNHGHYLRDSLCEILSQSRPPDEFIIIDDGSTDDSREIISGFRNRHSNICAILNEKNLGVIPNASHGLNIASGDYIYFAAADDRVLPDFFQHAMAAAEVNPQAGCISGDPVFFMDDGSAWISPLPLGDRMRVLSPELLVETQKSNPFLVPGHSSILRRSSVLQAGGQISALKWYADWFMNHVVSLRDGSIYIPKPLAAMRLSPNSYSGQNRVSWDDQRDVLRFLMDLLHSSAYADVVGYFAEAGLVAQLGPCVGRYVRQDRRMAAFLTNVAQRRLLIGTLRRKLGQALPQLWKRRVKNLLSLQPRSYKMPAQSPPFC
jgi:glycosyltransferase involved in cell wall biosynthesis